ncbi:CARDB domain-containing protein [Aeromicrobium stalagmiti]|uniref:CARDB domain-containing protein n=1 Tax=Aeromicrobium stalagmiti TaxID=2738988 RepID=UPI00156A71D0|nr:CARDB domain-containing protein [Aeromicrobium stalagmiti]NRQ48796.1 hypothetical protein [Aeromicrobium stalagmiti]
MKTTARCALLLTASALLGMTTLSGPAAAADRPNLQVTSTSTSTYSSADGATVRVRAVVKNAGRKTAGESQTGLYLSRDGNRSSSDKRLDREATRSLRRGQSTTKTLQGSLPATVAAGTWRLIVCADTSAQVRESSEANCRVWKTFTRGAPPAPTTGPSGGVASVCSGALALRPYANGIQAPPAGVTFSVAPTTSGAVPWAAPSVGVEWDYLTDDTPPHTVVTVTNTGTNAATGISQITAGPCQFDDSQGDFWGVLQSGPILGVDLASPCGSSIAAGASCDIAIGMTDPVARGGANRPGWIRIEGAQDVLAYFPVSVSSTSQGYWGGFETQPASSSFSNASPGSTRYRYVTVTNVGDRDALPVFRIEPDPGTPDGGIEVDSPDGWSAPNGYPAKCGTVLYDAINDVYAPATAPGGSCTIRIRACASLADRSWSADLVARHPADESQRSSRIPITFTSSSAEDASC